MIENTLDKEEIVAAYRTAQELYQNGTLVQKQQIVNLYLKRVVVYNDYLEIIINNVPSTFLKPCEIEKGLPSEDDGQSVIHIYEKWLENQEMSAPKLERTPLNVVEARQPYLQPHFLKMIIQLNKTTPRFVNTKEY